jgi:hypothetical protein
MPILPQATECFCILAHGAGTKGVRARSKRTSEGSGVTLRERTLAHDLAPHAIAGRPAGGSRGDPSPPGPPRYPLCLPGNHGEAEVLSFKS